MKPNTVGRVSGGLKPPIHAQHLCHGLPVGTPILTADGCLPVEFLSPGDRIVTRNGGMTTLDSIHAVTRPTRLLEIAPGALGEVVPEAHLYLPAEQPVLLRDWRAENLYGQSQAMAAASMLIGQAGVTDLGERTCILFRLEFASARIVYAGGLELCSMPMINAPLRVAA